MYQAFVYSLSSGKATSRDFASAERAAESLAALLRTNGHASSREDLAAELATGRTVTHGRYMYWVKEAA